MPDDAVMRIAMISEHASPLAALGGVDAGGQNLHVAELSAALAAAGHEVRVYTRRDSRKLPDIVECGPGVSVVHVPAGPAKAVPKDGLLPFMGAFGQWLAAHWGTSDWAPDVVHAHFWMSGLAALTARARYPVPVVQTYHALGSVKRRYQGAQDTSPAQRIGYERILGRQVDQVIAQCSDELAELVALGVPRQHIRLVPSGVDATRFTPSGPAALQPGTGRILSVGRLVERKGYADLIEAMRLLPDAEAVIVGGPPVTELGDDPVAQHLLSLARERGVADRVTLTGAVPREEMPMWYRSADLVACPAWYEPFGLTPLEAMACGVPVVAYAVGGFIDTVVDNVTGHLVPQRDWRALAKTLRMLLIDPVRRLEFGAAAVDRAAECYSWARTADQLLAIYRRLADVREPAEATAEVVTLS
jgi:glycosyltransferase involved in cell wall biosynthesis